MVLNKISIKHATIADKIYIKELDIEDIDSYKSVLLIIGSPALVIIYKVLELWTAQQNSQIEQTRKGTFRNGNHAHE